MDWDVVSYYAYRLAGALAPRVPPAIGYRIAEQLGSIVYRLSPLRANVHDNISHVIGEPTGSRCVQRLARQIFRNQCKNYFDLLRVAGLTADDVRKAVSGVSGVEHLDHALTRGRGVILASGHCGNIDLAGQSLALWGYNVLGVAEHLRPERLFRYLRLARESHGLRFMPADGSLRSLFRALQANEIVGLALDRNVTNAGRVVAFFRQPARLPDGYLRLALHTGAALILVFCRRLPDNTFVITIEPEAELERSDDLERDVGANMPSVLSILESYLARHPDQWVYFQPVWLPAQAAASETAVSSTARLGS